MQTVLLHSESKSDMLLLVELAKKIGIKVRLITDEEIEDIGLSNAIKEGRTGKYVNTEEFVKKLRK